ncbi:putative receptor-like protein kinase At3g47110 [Arabidopsis lyrata subsp. lyrata]|uniref:putative receptor-like protein kinase At3g47110 n=1 Tax=Arabidopsis lyrata subsp. lyrata TaxID=81972 RepID=UPI000A29BF64|nr:putative receptor-like protein kinase At3g47110 [Arabidopsis lyrata subsp. lyrata]|eukprot:XP_020865750.1 putative receptor-like protein kinase At3g47110 [Arabidopsis lyrata subsp. lyrata]
MEGKVFLGQNLIWVMLLMGQLHGYKSCIDKERNALFELRKYMISRTEEDQSDSVLPTWTNDTTSDCCRWKGVACNRVSGRVTEIAFGGLSLKDNSLLNLSLLHPFEDVRSLNLSSSRFSGLFDDVEGYKSLRRLRKLEILDLSSNKFNNSIFHFLSAATSLTTLFLRSNNMVGSFPAKELRDLTNLELLDLSRNRFNGSIPIQELSSLRKLKALDLSGNEFSGSMELQGKFSTNLQEWDL